MRCSTPWQLETRHHARSIRSDHTAGGRACLEITGASKRPERGNSPDTRRAPGSADMQGVQTTEPAEPQAGPEDPFAELPPPVTPLEAKRVWDEQRRPSARSVAKALTQAGRPVHFTTVARWKKRPLLVPTR